MVDPRAGIRAARAEPPGPLAVRVTETADIGPTTARLETSTTGSFDVRKGANGTANTTVSLDASTVPQGNGPIDGVLQVRYEVRTTATPGASKLNLGVGKYQESDAVPIASSQLEPGAATTLVTQVMALTCQGRSRCALEAPIYAIAPDDGPDVHVEWTLTATWFPEPGTDVPDGLDLVIETTPASPAP